MQRQNQRNCAFLRRTIHDFFRKVLIPSLQILASLGLDIRKTIINADELIDAIHSHTVNQRIARIQRIRRRISTVALIGCRSRKQTAFHLLATHSLDEQVVVSILNNGLRIRLCNVH